MLPRQIPAPVMFPVDTLLYAEKDGKQLAYTCRTRFLKKFKPGEPMPTVFVRLGGDWRCPKDFFSWLGSGATVEIHNGALAPEELAAIASKFGTWNAPRLTVA